MSLFEVAILICYMVVLASITLKLVRLFANVVPKLKKNSWKQCLAIFSIFFTLLGTYAIAYVGLHSLLEVIKKMKKCFEDGQCSGCNNIKVLAALDFYNSNPQPGDKVVARGDEKKEVVTIRWIGDHNNRMVGGEERVLGPARVCEAS